MTDDSEIAEPVKGTPVNVEITPRGRRMIDRQFEEQSGEWCLHCGSDTCEHATRHNAAYGKAAIG
jgi:hypothetical protein